MKKFFVFCALTLLLLVSIFAGIAKATDGSMLPFTQGGNQGGGNQGGTNDPGPVTDNSGQFGDVYTLTVIQAAHGTISPGTTAVNYGDSQTFTITPQTGYHVVDLIIDGTSHGAIATYTFSSIMSDHTISATFAANTGTINVGQVTHGSIASYNGTTANYGDNLQFAITPSNGYHIATIAVDGSSVAVTNSSGQTCTFSNITANHTITATFSINTYTISVEAYASTIGTTGVQGSDNNHFSYMYGLATDSEGNLYVADCANDRVQKFSSNGTYLATIKPQWMEQPMGVAVDSEDNLYVANIVYCVAKFSISGQPISAIGQSYLSDALCVAVDSVSNIYVTANQINCVVKFSSNGTLLGTIGNGQLSEPAGVAVDSEDNVYVADYNLNFVAKFSSNGTLLSTIGTSGVPGSDNYHFKGSSFIAIDSNNNIYVCDTENHRVQLFSSSGQYIATLGVTGAAGNDNNHFNRPLGIAVDSNHNIYVSDNNNQRVQKFAVISNFSVDVTSVIHGSITSSNGTTASYGDNLQFTINPSTGYHIASIMVDGSSVAVTNSSSQVCTFTNITANHVIWTIFAINTYAVNVDSTTKGSISSNNGTIANYGDNMQFAITPIAGYHIASITVDGSSVGITNSSGQTYTFSAISANHTISATFATRTYQITVTSVHGNPTSSATVNLGDNFTVSVTTPENAETGHRWMCQGYSIDNGTLQTGTTYTFTNVTADHAITYQWNEEYYLTVNAGKVGTASGQGWYAAGTTAQAQLTCPTVQPGTTGTQYVFSGWTTGTASSNTTSLQLTMDSAKTVTTTWQTQNQVSITCNQTQGQTTPNGAVWVPAGTSLAITAQPNTGFAFNGWAAIAGIVSMTSNAQNTTSTCISTPQTIVANFAAIIPSAANSNTITAVKTTDHTSYTVGVGGNVTAQQCSNMTIAQNATTRSTIVSFSITGPTGTNGLVNLTLPTAAIPYGSKPTVYVDGQLAQIQGFSQDSSHYYVWFTTHFSTHQIDLEFTTQPEATNIPTPTPTQATTNNTPTSTQAATTNTPAPTQAATTLETATIPQALTLITAIVSIVLVVFVLVVKRRRQKGKS